LSTYGKVHSRFWTSADIRGLSDAGKLLACYLITGPHKTMLGCYRLPFEYVAADLGWTVETVSERFDELSAKGFITVDKDTSWVLIHTFLRWNPLENPNQEKAAAKLIVDIPNKSSVCQQLTNVLTTYAPKLQKGFQNGSETVSKPLPNQKQKQEQYQNQIQEDKPAKAAGIKERRLRSEKIYSLYPKKVAKDDGLRAIDRAQVKVASRDFTGDESKSAEWLSSRVRAYADSPEGNNADKTYIPYPASWFNDGRYDDDDSVWSGNANSNSNGYRPPKSSSLVGAK
jgi:hypothetical protein